MEDLSEQESMFAIIDDEMKSATSYWQRFNWWEIYLGTAVSIKVVNIIIHAFASGAEIQLHFRSRWALCVVHIPFAYQEIIWRVLYGHSLHHKLIWFYVRETCEILMDMRDNQNIWLSWKVTKFKYVDELSPWPKDTIAVS